MFIFLTFYLQSRRAGAGDLIYADGPIPPVTPFSPDLNGTALDYVQKAVGAAEFKNTFTKNFTAVTLPEFRKNWQYTFGDSKVKALLEAQPILATWDDHVRCFLPLSLSMRWLAFSFVIN